MLLFWFSRICLINVMLHEMHGYVLFAANLDDFRSIAKKFIPEKLADQLAEMASKSSVKHHKMAEEQDAEYESNESEEDGVTKSYTNTELPNTTVKKRYIVKSSIPEVNLDELVERVRERLLKGKHKPKQKAIINEKKGKILDKTVDNKMNHPNYEAENVDYKQNSYGEEKIYENREPDYEEVTTKRQKAPNKPKIDVKEIQNDSEESQYEENIKIEEPNQYVDDGKIFQEVDLQHTNDSYEEYATPGKEKIFESEETTTKRKPIRQMVKKYSTERSPKDYEDVRARTESLLYDEKKIRVNRTIHGASGNLKTTKKGKGTMIPTRKYYKMSSPDYYKKLPVVAEKYNFDEPLPEKDREPENLKHIGNPPARINKKVRLGLQPLSIQNLMKYTEIPPKFTLVHGKRILLEQDRNKYGGRMLSGSFNAFSGRRRMI